jgi:hypothetical protein
MTLINRGSNASNPEVVVDSPSVGSTWLAGLSAAVTALLAAAISIFQGLDVLNLSDPVKIGLIGLIGAGILGWAIATSGDALARAYAQAHVTRVDGENNQPALQTAANKIAEVYAAAHGVSIISNSADQGAPAIKASQEQLCPFPTPLKVKVRGNDAQAIAVLLSSTGGKETQKYLIGVPGDQITWVDDAAISIPSSDFEASGLAASIRNEPALPFPPN